jgi:hypothetical protein
VVKKHDDDGERAEKIEAWLAFAVFKARIDPEVFAARLCPGRGCSFGFGFRNGGNLADQVRTLNTFGR